MGGGNLSLKLRNREELSGGREIIFNFWPKFI